MATSRATIIIRVEIRGLSSREREREKEVIVKKKKKKERR